MNINQYRQLLKRTVDTEAQAVAERALELSNQYTPVRSGFLRSRNKLSKDGSDYILSNDAPYALFRYFGTSKFAGVKWFRIALDRIRSGQ